MTCRIVLRQGPDPRPGHYGNALLLSCACAPYTLRSQHGGRPAHEVIEARTRWTVGEALAVLRAWHERGVTV